MNTEVDGGVASPMVSILCLTYNHEAFVAQALESFLSQVTTFDVEIVVSDDCSSDDTVLVVERFRERVGDRIRLLRSATNVGVTRNFRRALAACRGRYVALCEGDDFWRGQDKLQRQVDFLESSPEFVIAYHDATVIGSSASNGQVQLPRRFRRDATRAELIAARPISTLTACFRNVLETLPPELDHAPALDLCLWSLLGHHGAGKYMPSLEPAAYRVHDGGVFSTQGERNKYIMTSQSLLCLARTYARLGRPALSNALLFRAMLMAACLLPPLAFAKLVTVAPIWALGRLVIQSWRALVAPRSEGHRT